MFHDALVEAQFYGLKKFRLQENVGKYRVINCDFRIVVEKETQLHVLFDSSSNKILEVLRMEDADEDAVLGRTKVGNVLHATRTLINADTEEIDSFRKSYIEKYGDGSASCTGVSCESSQESTEEYVEGVTKKCAIIELFDHDEAAFSRFVWVVDSFDFTGGWNYISCSRYLRILDKMADVFYCQRCTSHD